MIQISLILHTNNYIEKAAVIRLLATDEADKMATGKAKNHKSQPQKLLQTPAATAGATSDFRFGCTPKELKELMEIRGPEAIARIRNKYGSMDELCRRLAVSPNEGAWRCITNINNNVLRRSIYIV